MGVMTNKVRKYMLTMGAYLLSLPVVVVIVFFVVIFLAGPHAGLLPHPLEVVILVLGWLSVLAVPVWVAARVWRRVGAPHAAQQRAAGDAKRAHLSASVGHHEQETDRRAHLHCARFCFVTSED
jgi:hypothetical protein